MTTRSQLKMRNKFRGGVFLWKSWETLAAETKAENPNNSTNKQAFSASISILIKNHMPQNYKQKYCTRNALAKSPMHDFQVWTDSNNFIHIPTKGAFFTWSNKRSHPFFIESRLDRYVANQILINTCIVSSISMLPKLRSDHFLILLDVQIQSHKKASQFRFLKAWTMHKDCIIVIEYVWRQKDIGCLMLVIYKKLQLLKHCLRKWNHSSFGNITLNIKLAEDKMKDIHAQPIPSWEEDLFKKMEFEAQVSLSNALDIKECYWKEKYKIQWHLEGDKNTAYFHRITKIKNAYKPITLLREGEECYTETSQIANHIVNFFQNIFSPNTSVL
ncbi:unnamed protein product [Vicia faba]|uniref:Uncharacterized protein n=1 Tax=Vicia faba TaxID=3906 RepID=A0AAV1ARX7_VICFA|nr:unnamed protein product [Vicia faba]